MSESVESFQAILKKQCTKLAMRFSWEQSLKRMFLTIFWIMTLSQHKTNAQEWPYRIVEGARELTGNIFAIGIYCV